MMPGTVKSVERLAWLRELRQVTWRQVRDMPVLPSSTVAALSSRAVLMGWGDIARIALRSEVVTRIISTT